MSKTDEIFFLNFGILIGMTSGINQNTWHSIFVVMLLTNMLFYGYDLFKFIWRKMNEN